MSEAQASPIEGINWDQICDIIGWIGTVIGIILNITPIVLFYQIIRKVEKYTIVPESMLFFNILCGGLWYCYWFRQGVFVACFSAGVGTILSIIFAIIYVYFFVGEHCTKWLFGSIIVLDIVAQFYYLFVYFIPQYQTVGTIAMVVNIITYAAPGQNIIKVIKEGSYKLIPITTTVVGAFCSISWLSFGLLKNDINCIVPNVLGLIFSTINIVTWTVFYLKSKKADDGAKGQELKEVEGEDKEYQKVSN